MELKEILLEDEFRNIQKEGKGFIAITDGSKCRIHSVKCPNVDLYYFEQKLLITTEKMGAITGLLILIA